MVRWESVVISLIGAAVGAALGIGLGMALSQSLKGDGITEVVRADRAGRWRTSSSRRWPGCSPRSARPGRPPKVDVLKAVVTD